MGKRHQPFYRINAVESRTPRDGRIIEKLGQYHPIVKDPAKQVVLNRERIEYWLGKGAIPSDTVSQILLRHGIKHKHVEQKTARRTRAKIIARKKGLAFTKAEKLAAQKAAEEAKEAAKKAAEEAKEAAKKAEEEAKQAADKAAEEAKDTTEETKEAAEENSA
jgi:small subunit ribosomal protein S16